MDDYDGSGVVVSVRLRFDVASCNPITGWTHQRDRGAQEGVARNVG